MKKFGRKIARKNSGEIKVNIMALNEREGLLKSNFDCL